MSRLWMMLLVLALGCSSFAELKLAAIFADGMVLQRDQEVPVWGWADAGAEVTVSFGDQEQIGKAAQDGAFMVRLKKMTANAEPQVLVVRSGDECAEIKHVLVGEVWLCSGQSNMAMEVKECKDFELEKVAAVYPLIRMFTVVRNTSRTPLETCVGQWAVCSPGTVGDFSATAYFFGREIYKQLEVPVGLIHSSWGGTRIEAWSPMASLEQYPSVMSSKAHQDASAEKYNEKVVKEKYAEVLSKWKAQSKQAKADGTKVPRRPNLRVNPHKNQNYPANLYNAMIHPLVPYGMRGAIWYQGEANAHSIESAMLYRDLLENMVVQWRKDWDMEFPFYAVQLVGYRAAQTKPVEDCGWAFSRESFLKFHREVPNVGMAVGIDVGEADDIHPKNKQAIGYRLAQQALAKRYGKAVVSGGPLYASMMKEDGKIILQFDDVGSGLVAQDGGVLTRFAIAGVDKKFVAARAEIVGDTVVVSSEKVSDPVAVRYAWANNPVGCNLFNKEGFPASPFRTDDWPPVTE